MRGNRQDGQKERFRAESESVHLCRQREPRLTATRAPPHWCGFRKRDLGFSCTPRIGGAQCLEVRPTMTFS